MHVHVLSCIVGIKVSAECLGRSQKSVTQECAQNLLHELSVVIHRERGKEEGRREEGREEGREGEGGGEDDYSFSYNRVIQDIRHKYIKH